MTRKDFKLNDTSKGLPENFDLWEELEDKTGEKISGGQAVPIKQKPQQSAGTKDVVFPFEFENEVNFAIDVTLLNGSKQVIQLQPVGLPGSTTIVNRPAQIITIEFDTTIGGGNDLVRENMNFDQLGIFRSLPGGTIEFVLE